MGSNILIIGASSKLADVFLSSCDPDADTTYWLTCRPSSAQSKQYPNIDSRSLALDLSSEKSVIDFCKIIKKVPFDSVLNFSATYETDAIEPSTLYSQHLVSLTTNVISFHTICKSLRYNLGAVIIAFGDAELHHPKKNHGSYTITKQLLQRTIESLAVDLAPDVRVVEIRLGPTLTKSRSADYYNRCLLKPDRPEVGLTKLIHFLLHTNNLYITGSSIIYDGGARLSR